MKLRSPSKRHALGVAFGLVAACSVPNANAESHSTHELMQLLRKMQLAPQRLNFSGIFVYQQLNQIRTSRISHMLDAGVELEKVEILDGRPREYLRRNDEVSSYLPDSKIVQVEKRVTQTVFPSLFSGNPLLLPELYNLSKSDVSRVAGVDCDNLNFEAKDSYRYSYRLCVERSTGLIVRAQTLNDRNQVIEQIAFTQIVIGDVEKNVFRPSFGNVAQWHVENIALDPEAKAEWHVKALPAGFKKTREMRRSMVITPDDADASGRSEAGERSAQVVQMIFSDGLASLSVFIEPNSGRRAEGSLQQGAVTIMGKRQGDFWLTAVGEVPFAAIKQVINSIEFKPK